jgi:hypothetical protein
MVNAELHPAFTAGPVVGGGRRKRLGFMDELCLAPDFDSTP